MNNQNLLQITEIGDVLTSSDDRNYRVVRFQKLTQPGVFSNAKVRTRVLWEEGPMGSAGDPLYKAIVDGKAGVGSKVLGNIESINVQEYYIVSENGKYQHPETGEPANKADRFTSVVFEDESIESLARSQKHTIPGEMTYEQAMENASQENEVISQELDG